MSTALHTRSFSGTAGFRPARPGTASAARPERSHLRLVEPLAESYAAPRAEPTPRAALAPRTHLRITRRGRILISTLVTVAVLAAFGIAAMLGGSGATASSAAAHVSFTHVTVQPGESLWDIAEGLNSSADPRDVIIAIEQLNDLSSSDITAGESLAIPLQYTK